jgi:sugar phosphate isomerase/epimerase
VELAFIAGYTEPFSEEYFTRENAADLKEQLKKHNLCCTSFSSHVNLADDGIVPLFKKRMEFAKNVGAHTIVTNAAPKEREAVFLENMTSLSSFAEKLELKIGLENPGDGSINVINRGSDCQEMIDSIDCNWVGINYDFGNLVSHCFEQVRPESDYKLCKNSTVHYHVKDVKAAKDGWYFPSIGQGDIDYRSILQDLAQDNPVKPISLEIPLRLRRDKNAQPVRSNKKIPLQEIEQVLKSSIQFVRDNLTV